MSNESSSEDLLCRFIEATKNHLRNLNTIKQSLETQCSAIHSDIVSFSQQQFARVTDLFDYAQQLNQNKDRITILLASRGSNNEPITAEQFWCLTKLGLGGGLEGKTWKSYLAAIIRGNVVYELIGKDTESISYDLNINGHSVHMASASINSGDNAQISCDGVNYAPNLRGLNFVIINETGEKLDAVVFVTSMNFSPCIRSLN